MRREEAIKTLEENLCAMCAYGSQNMNSCDIRGCDNRDAIEALKQESVLDKIRAEIESIERYGTVNGHDIWLRTPEEIKKEVLKIIDKYKRESEAQE